MGKRVTVQPLRQKPLHHRLKLGSAKETHHVSCNQISNSKDWESGSGTQLLPQSTHTHARRARGHRHRLAHGPWRTNEAPVLDARDRIDRRANRVRLRLSPKPKRIRRCHRRMPRPVRCWRVRGRPRFTIVYSDGRGGGDETTTFPVLDQIPQTNHQRHRPHLSAPDRSELWERDRPSGE